MSTTNIAVLDHDAHGIPAADYVDALRGRLPNRRVELAATPARRRRLLREAAVIAGKELGAENVAAVESLRLFACNTAGADHLPLEALADRGVAVTNAAGVHGLNVAEYVFGWIPTFARQIDEGHRRQQRREWRHFQSFTKLADSTVTIVGLGAIGEAIAERLDGFGTETIGVRHSPEKGGPTDEVVGYGDLTASLPATGVLVLACPLTETTAGLVGEAELDALPTDAIVVNVARGGVVDTAALVDAVRSNAVHGAALNVTDPEPLPADHDLWGFENVFLTPHVAGHTPNYWERRAEILDRVAQTGEYADLRNQVA